MKRWVVPGFAIVIAVAAVIVAWPGPVEAILLQGSFVDDNSSPHQNGIEALAAQGITKGCNPPAHDRFCPDRTLTRAETATFLARAFNYPDDGENYFIDDDGHNLEGGINRIAAAGITQGCNPPLNDRFCPDRTLTRAEFAAFIARALNLPPTSNNHFSDDNGHVLESAINRIAEAGITVGCNPPANTQFCPNRILTRGETATLLTRALKLPQYPQLLPLSNWNPVSCSKDGKSCTLLVDTFDGRFHLVEEGFFNIQPFAPGEQSAFNSASTEFILTLDGVELSTTESSSSNSSQATRKWSKMFKFSPGQHTLVGEWRWRGSLVQRTVVTVRAG